MNFYGKIKMDGVPDELIEEAQHVLNKIAKYGVLCGTAITSGSEIMQLTGRRDESRLICQSASPSRVQLH